MRRYQHQSRRLLSNSSMSSKENIHQWMLMNGVITVTVILGTDCSLEPGNIFSSAEGRTRSSKSYFFDTGVRIWKNYNNLISCPSWTNPQVDKMRGVCTGLYPAGWDLTSSLWSLTQCGSAGSDKAAECVCVWCWTVHYWVISTDPVIFN